MSEIPRLVRTLDVASHPQAGRPAHVSAGSGLVCRGPWAYVAIDDELHVGVFDLRTDAPGTLVRVLPGRLPLEHQARKAHKPDLESLLELDAAEGPLLLGVPSGSTSRRSTGFASPLSAGGELAGAAAPIDWTDLLDALRDAMICELNIEGATMSADSVLLFARDTAGAGRIITLDGETVVEDVLAGAVTRRALRATSGVELGELDGVPLGFTDATIVDGRVLFSAAAEDTDNPYDDGPITGSVIGELQPGGGGARVLLRLPAAVGKVEGLAMLDDRHLCFVTDDDDVTRASRMYTLPLPG